MYNIDYIMSKIPFDHDLLKIMAVIYPFFPNYHSLESIQKKVNERFSENFTKEEIFQLLKFGISNGLIEKQSNEGKTSQATSAFKQAAIKYRLTSRAWEYYKNIDVIDPEELANELEEIDNMEQRKTLKVKLRHIIIWTIIGLVILMIIVFISL